MPGRLIVVMSDIHANEPALRAVIHEAEQIARERQAELSFVCLGDVVDYGPHPQACMRLVRALPCLAWIQGNHDREASRPLHCAPEFPFRPDIWPMHFWTRSQLEAEETALLARLPSKLELDEPVRWTLVHSTLAELDGYLHTNDAAQRDFALLTTPYGFCGHTHHQGFFLEQPSGRVLVAYGFDQKLHATAAEHDGYANVPSDPDANWVIVQVNEWYPMPKARAIFNSGSVGQPRTPLVFGSFGVDQDYRAAALFIHCDPATGDQYSLRRVPYDRSAVLTDLDQIQASSHLLATLRATQDLDLRELAHDFPQRLERQVRILKRNFS
jgi:predicted phosphodiesterase